MFFFFLLLQVNLQLYLWTISLFVKCQYIFVKYQHIFSHEWSIISSSLNFCFFNYYWTRLKHVRLLLWNLNILDYCYAVTFLFVIFISQISSDLLLFFCYKLFKYWLDWLIIDSIQNQLNNRSNIGLDPLFQLVWIILKNSKNDHDWISWNIG